MEKVEDYRPDEINFTVEADLVPKVLGQFESEEDARVFMAENLLAVQCKLDAQREMDALEIVELRNQYADELEKILPSLREELRTKDA